MISTEKSVKSAMDYLGITVIKNRTIANYIELQEQTKKERRLKNYKANKTVFQMLEEQLKNRVL